MEQPTLGRTELQVSAIGFGGAQVGITNYIQRWDAAGAAEQESIIAALDHALDMGINYIDTAPAYGKGISEEVLGRVIGSRRDQCIIATKTGASAPQAIRDSVTESLRRLQTDVIDILQFHGGWYSQEDADAILDGGGLETYQQLQDEGKVRFLGFTVEGPTAAAERLIASDGFDVMQVRFNFMNHQTCDFNNPGQGIVHQARARDMGIVTMRTMTSGVFQQIMRECFPALADEDLNAFLLNYNLSNPHLDVVLVGMRTVAEVEANVALCDAADKRLDLEKLHDRFPFGR